MISEITIKISFSSEASTTGGTPTVIATSTGRDIATSTGGEIPAPILIENRTVTIIPDPPIVDARSEALSAVDVPPPLAAPSQEGGDIPPPPTAEASGGHPVEEIPPPRGPGKG